MLIWFDSFCFFVIIWLVGDFMKIYTTNNTETDSVEILLDYQELIKLVISLKKFEDEVNQFKTKNKDTKDLGFTHLHLKDCGLIDENGKFIVEGIINFRSGTTKKTSFVFEGKTISKTGRMKLLGENKEIGTGRNAFVLRAKYDNGKVMCESLTYNYNTKDGNKQVNVYGKAKISK